MTNETETRENGKGRNRTRRGCRLPFVLIVLVLIVLAIVNLGWLLMRTDSFAEWVRGRAEQTLSDHLQRTVTIEHLSLDLGRRSTITAEGVRIGNLPEASEPNFAVVDRITVEALLDSILARHISLENVTVENPQAWIELFDTETEPRHNIPSWIPSPPRRFELSHTSLETVKVRNGSVDLRDYRHDLRITAQRIDSSIDAAAEEHVYDGTGSSGEVEVRLQDYEPIRLVARGGYRYEPDMLSFRTVRLSSRAMQATVSGRIQPLSEQRYEFRIDGIAALARLREIFGIEKDLTGPVTFEGHLAGEAGDFELAGDIGVSAVHADIYEVTDLAGHLLVTNDAAKLTIDSAGFHEGSLNAVWTLDPIAEPYLMKLDAGYSGVSIESLLSNWDVRDIGILGGANGSLHYEWEGDDLLGGKGEGEAAILATPSRKSRAPHPTPVNGFVSYALDGGVLTFREAALRTQESTINFGGTLEIENLASSLDYTIDTRAFGDVDRLLRNLSSSLGTGDAELLGLGGYGEIHGKIGGRLDAVEVTASAKGSGLLFNDVVQGDAIVDLSYSAATETLLLNRCDLSQPGERLAIRGSILLDDALPDPVLDLRVRADEWSVPRAIKTTELDLEVSGQATGDLAVKGMPKHGTVTFTEVNIAQATARLTLNGEVDWGPGEEDVVLNLDVGAESVPVEDIATFLEISDVPATGNVTGTLHVEGPKATLEGAGNVILRSGTIADEPIQLATADLLFSKGALELTFFQIEAEAGTISGEAAVDFEGERFSYVLEPAEIDLAKLKTYKQAAWIDGTILLTSSGAGSFQRPDLVFNATLERGRIRGIEIVEGSHTPRLYFATREGQIIIEGSAFDLLSISGKGSLEKSGDIEASVEVRIDDLKRFLAIVEPTTSVDVTGRIDARIEITGNTSAVETMQGAVTLDVFDLTVSGNSITSRTPVVIGLREGRLRFDDVAIQSRDSDFKIDGTIELVEDQRIDLSMRGVIEASILQLVVPDMILDGQLRVATDMAGTLEHPKLTGTVEIQKGNLRFGTFPQTIGNVYGTLIFRERRIDIDSFRASFGGGTLTAGGFITHESLVPQRVRVNVKGDGVSIRYYEGVTIDGDFNFVLSGDMERQLLQGDFAVRRGLYYKDFDFASSILNLLLERRELLPEVAASWQDNIALRVDLSAPGTLAVKNNVGDLTASADLEITGTLASPIVLGRVTIDEGGNLKFQDIDYRVVQGTINLQNPFRNDPYLDITAESRISRTTGDLGPSQEYDLTVNLTGTLDRIQPTISSDPPIGELTLLTLLSGDIGVGGGGPVSMAGASLLLSTFGGALGSKILPFADSLRVDPGLVGDSSSFAPIVTFEKTISNDLHVIVIYETGSTENREIIQWQVSSDWVIQFTRDSQQTDTYLVNAVDARFRRRYKAHW